jgi:alcohol dehydrogenase YqhD (iron-dependent ADH family)
MITTFQLPTKLLFGPGSVTRLGEEARKIGQRALLVTGVSSMRRTGVLDRVVGDLKANGLDPLIFDGVEANPRSSTVDKGAESIRSEKLDLVISLGGGSCMDAAKGMALASGGTESIWYYLDLGVKPQGSIPSLIHVPTIAGSGAELNNFGVITNWESHEKRPIISPYLWPKVAIVDPELTLTVPSKQTRQGGVDIFTHLVEPYITNGTPSPMNDGILETAMKIVVKFLPQVLAGSNDINARTQLSWASTIAVSQISLLGGGASQRPCHYLEYAPGGYYDIAHADGLAALLPAWMKFIFPVRQDRLELLGKNIFGIADGITGIEQWLKKVGMNLRLRDLGFEIDRADEMAEMVVRMFGQSLDLHPKKLDASAIAQIYRDSY